MIRGHIKKVAPPQQHTEAKMLEFLLDGVSVLAALIAALCWFKASRVHVPAPAETKGKGALLGGWLIGCLRGERVDLVATTEAQAKWNAGAAGAASVAALFAAASLVAVHVCPN